MTYPERLRNTQMRMELLLVKIVDARELCKSVNAARIFYRPLTNPNMKDVKEHIVRESTTSILSTTIQPFDKSHSIPLSSRTNIGRRDSRAR